MVSGESNSSRVGATTHHTSLGEATDHTTYGDRYVGPTMPSMDDPKELQAYVSKWYWHHEIDLGSGVSTVPAAHSREELLHKFETFRLGDLTGKSVLDIGGWDGGFAFLAEQFGASRVSVLDYYSWATDYDEYQLIFQKSLESGDTPPAPHETSAWHPDTLPTLARFDVARQVSGSKVTAIPMDIMDCDLDEVGRWDVVLLLGVIYHMPDPLNTLRRVAAVTNERLIVETEAMVIPGYSQSLFRFFAGGELNNDRTNWWVPNLQGLKSLIEASGFSNVEVLVGEPALPAGSLEPHHYRAIVGATR